MNTLYLGACVVLQKFPIIPGWVIEIAPPIHAYNIDKFYLVRWADGTEDVRHTTELELYD